MKNPAPKPAPSAPAPETPVLDVRGVVVHRGRTVILIEIAWQVRSGEHWVILGANGSGKTSLLASLTGYLSPTRGEISVLGRTFGRADWRELRKEIGMVGSTVRQMMPEEEPALISVVSGKHAMIDYWGRVTREDRARATALLEQVDCSHLAARPWSVLSQGERQRVLIGRALMASPRILILDEPCAGLDPAARERFLQFLERLGRQPGAPTLVLVTHHVEEIMPVFTHALALRQGRVLDSGVKEKVLKSTTLSEVFNARVRLSKSGGRYSLRIAAEDDRIM